MKQLLLTSAACLFLIGGLSAEEATDEIDEVVSLEKKPTRVLRAELRRIEDQMFDEFNDLNHDDEYDIICKQYAPIGSQIPVRHCKARMYWEADIEIVEEDEGFTVLNAPRIVDAKKHGTMLRMRMLKAAIENKSFRDTLIQRKRILDTIEARKKR